MRAGKHRGRAGFAIAAACGAVLLLIPAAASALTYPVTTNANTGAGSFRDALVAANGTSANDAISITATGSVQLTSALPGIPSVATGGTLTIQGPGADQFTLRRNSGTFGILSSSAGSNSTVSGLSLSNGNTASGGGIFNAGTMVLEGVDVDNNVATSAGGGIANNNGTLTLRNSVVHDNDAGGAGGGGIYNGTTSTLIVEQSTIYQNSSPVTDIPGGGIASFGPVTISSSTIAANSGFSNASVHGQNIFIQGAAATLSLANTLIADARLAPGSTDPSAVNCQAFLGATITSSGYNLADDPSCNLVQGTDQPSTPAGVAPFLARNGGPTQTLALIPGSAALDKIPAGSCLFPSDQRGVARPQGATCDIGAFEREVAPPTAFSNPAPITINDNAAATPYPSSLTVSGFQGPVAGVTVRLNQFIHEYPDDVDVLLVGPQGQNSILMSDVGGSQESGATLSFSDAATAGIPDEGPLTSGTFKPTNTTDTPADAFPLPAPAGPWGTGLATFNGVDPNGTWLLYVLDDENGDVGTIYGGWGLDLQKPASPLPAGPTGKRAAALKKCKKKKSKKARKKCKKKARKLPV